MALTRGLLDWVPHVHIKLDPKQATFTFPHELLPLARVIIYKRYVCVIGKQDNFSAEWCEQYADNRDQEPIDTTLDTLGNIKPIPSSYKQSRLQIFHEAPEHRKLLVTITIYRTGTVLVQGVKCQKWLNDEFDTLTHVIRAIYHLLHQQTQSDSINKALDCDMAGLPVPGVKLGKKGVVSVSPRKQTARKLLATTQLLCTSHPPNSPHPEDKEPTPPAVDYNDTPAHSSSSSAPNKDVRQTPSPSSRQSTTASASKSTPPLPRSKPRSPNKPLHPSPPPNPPSQPTTNKSLSPSRVTSHLSTPKRGRKILGCRRQPVQGPKRRPDAVVTLTALQRQVSRLSSRITSGVALQRQVSQQSSLIASGVREMKEMAAALQSMREDNLALRHQVAEQRAELQELRAAVRCGLPETASATPKPEPAASDVRKSTAVAVSTSNRFTVLEQKNGEPSSEAGPANLLADSDNKTRPSQSNQRQRITPPPSSSDPRTPSPKEKPSSIPQKKPVNNASSPNSAFVHSKPNSYTTDRLTTSKSSSSSPSTSPRQLFANSKVNSDTTHVLIGDSVSKPVMSHLVFRTSSSQNLSVSGLELDDVIHWLRYSPQSPLVRCVVVHVGVNSCQKNTLTESNWAALITLVRKVFPNASIQLSSIVPLWGFHPLKKTVTASNEAMKAACERERVTFINHHDTFITANNAPRKALYRDDGLHPSHQGTIRLANNIKYNGTGGQSDGPRHHGPHEQRSAPLQQDRDPAANRAPLLGYAPLPSRSYADRLRHQGPYNGPSGYGMYPPTQTGHRQIYSVGNWQTQDYQAYVTLV